MSEAESVRARVSVYDLMPETLARVLSLLAVLERDGNAPVALRGRDGDHLRLRAEAAGVNGRDFASSASD